MKSLVLALALAGGVVAGAQSDAPVFRVEADAVTVDFGVYRILPFIRVRRPLTGLTQEDVTFSIDKKTIPGATLTPDPKKPGRYLASGNLPDEYRDGAEHLLEVTIHGKGTRPTM